jgi:hypothetical protein
MSALRQATELSGGSIAVVGGKLVLSASTVQAVVANMATKVVGVAVSANMLTEARKVYNRFNCQQTILVGPSLTNPPTVFPGNGAPWQGGKQCRQERQTWQISYDGGQSWTSFDVVVQICVYPAVQ